MALWPGCPAACFSAWHSPESGHAGHFACKFHGAGRISLPICTIARCAYRYSEDMFEVLAFVYENYWHGDACPERSALQRKLNAVGFEDDEVQDALLWLEELKSATHSLRAKPAVTTSAHAKPPTDTTSAAMVESLRIFTAAEQMRLGREGWGLIAFLVSADVLPWQRLELVMDRAMAAPDDDVSVDDLKLIVLMVFWSLGEEPDALVLDELCDNRTDRVGH